ncbi:hypothetical protein L21_1808 [Methanoculleus chikugoensis]|uniref:DUF1059 domain-containing protein n=1 Tax=Methanoculleus chikugoensis TaxID=118126 RepID=A0A1M4MLS3_9EURY|nr:DUF1059 domain-containing protein [Methanoculleus chikugoensis]SCL75891.1 hypothetical protein L21_1808 [Methanoculleus chikugoensis]
MQEQKTFRCKDLGLACEFEEKAENENELMKRVEGHVQTALPSSAISPAGWCCSPS